MSDLVIMSIIIFAALIVVLFMRNKYYKTYKKRYEAALKELDDALVDTYIATRMIMEGADPMQINATVIEAVMKNYLVQRIFTKCGVLYFKEISAKWIDKRLDQVKETRII